MRSSAPVLLLVACAPSAAPVAATTAPSGVPSPRSPATAAGPVEPDDGMDVTGLLGTLDPESVQPVVERHSGAVEDCFRRGSGSRAYVGGRVELRLRVAADGAVSRAAVADDDLGAWAVEKCLLAAARKWTFARPHGGEAEVNVPLDLPARAPAGTDASRRADRALAVRLLDLAPCLAAGERGKAEHVDVTAYVGPGGAVISAGFAPIPQVAYDEAWADCALGRMLEWKLPDPRGSVWKVHGRLGRP